MKNQPIDPIKRLARLVNKALKKRLAAAQNSAKPKRAKTETTKQKGTP